MMSNNAEIALSEWLHNKGQAIDKLNIDLGLSEFASWYRQQRFDDCPPNVDGSDMLLYQWGIASSNRNLFLIDFTRQFINDGVGEDENIWQLALTFYFEPNEKLKSLGSGNKWCKTARERAVQHFEEWVRDSAAFEEALLHDPCDVSLGFNNVG